MTTVDKQGRGEEQWQRPCSGMKRAAMICYEDQDQHSMSSRVAEQVQFV
jgi:hypothetical protein